MTDKDRQDEDLERKTNINAPKDKIEDDTDLEDAIVNIEGLGSQLEEQAEDDDWAAALETAGELQEEINRIHSYISGKIE